MRIWMKSREESIKTLIEEDFKTGENGQEVRRENRQEDLVKRRSRDKKINAEGRVFVKRPEEVGWFIIDGDVEGDKNGD